MLGKIFGWLKPRPFGEPIHLEFPCGHYIDNPKPPVMSEEDRKLAKDQAVRTPCPRCNEPLWRSMREEGTYPELHTALQNPHGFRDEEDDGFDEE